MSSPDQYPENVEQIWLEFCKVETPEGHTFDPLQYLVAARRQSASPQSGDTWEQVYIQQPSLMGMDLISLVNKHYIVLVNQGDKAAVVESIRRIAETLSDPPEMPEGNKTGHKGDLLTNLFWALHKNDDYALLPDILAQSGSSIKEEDRYYMEERLKMIETEE